jgi:acyl dehydratase
MTNAGGDPRPEPRVGERREWSRTFTEDEIRRFADLSGDKGVHHLERDERGRLMVHGLLTATLPTKIGGDMNYIARDMRFEFLRPVYADEAIRCVGVVDTVDAEPRRWAVSFSFEATNPRGKIVMRGTSSGVILKTAA